VGSPLLRWQARAALARTERDVPDERGDADRHAAEAAEIVHGIVQSLTPEHAQGYLAARQVAEALDLAR
ncbi:MAG: hypothetical protein ACRDG8_06690, partial [Actinomycetota bacterium]